MINFTKESLKEYVNKQIKDGLEDKRILTNQEILLKVIDSDNGYDRGHSGKVPIDILIYESIKLLNEKGYITEFCCSGHPIGDFTQSMDNVVDVVTKDIIKSWYKNKKYFDGILGYDYNNLFTPGFYVVFKENYFEDIKLPKEFIIQSNKYFPCSIRTNDDLFNKTFKNISGSLPFLTQEEVEQLNRIFLNWVKTLPKIN